MLPLLALTHTALAVLVLVTRGVEAQERSRLIRFVAAVGCALALVLFFARGIESTWGAQTLSPPAGGISAAAILVAWLLVWATDAGRGRWAIASLVGVGSTALLLFATGRWLAPALLFWLALSAALVVGVHEGEGRGPVLLAIGLSDVCVAGGLIALSLDAESWRMPTELSGWFIYPLLAGVLLRAGVLPRVGVWGLLARDSAPLLPLVVGSAFALVPAISGGDEIAVALPLLLAAVAWAGWGILSRLPAPALVAGWITCAMLAVAWVEPRALGRAGVTAILGLGVSALWPDTAGRGQSERGLVLAAVPMTIGFGVVVGGASASFERVVGADTVLGAAPWSAFSALLPVALAAGVTLGAAIARRHEPERFRPEAVVAAWALAGAAVLLGASPNATLGFAAGRATWLYVAAVAAALGAARFVPAGYPVLLDRAEVPGTGTFEPPPALGRPLMVGAAMLVLASVGAIAWFTVAGLRVGFL